LVQKTVANLTIPQAEAYANALLHAATLTGVKVVRVAWQEQFYK
jgi:hypothetical protein